MDRSMLSSVTQRTPMCGSTTSDIQYITLPTKAVKVSFWSLEDYSQTVWHLGIYDLSFRKQNAHDRN
jgi:hypothetical protein